MKKFKKITAVMLSGIMAFGALTALPVCASAAETSAGDVSSSEYVSGDYEYRLLDDGTAAISGYMGAAAELEIPSKIDGYTVTRIDSYAFEYCVSFASVTIPDSVTSIGSFVFDDTAWYDNQPDGLVYVGKFAYGYKGDMPENTSITLKDGTKGIVGGAFRNCKNLISVTIPDSVTSIGDYTFYCCTNLTNITIPNSVTSIGDSAFNCCGLTNITIPDSVTSIGSLAFYFCSNLASITIPDSVTSMGYNVFLGTAWYDNQPDGLVYAGKVAYEYKGAMPENTSITLKDGTKGIADFAFEYCENLISIAIPNSVASIGDSTFYHCTNLTSITIPDRVTNIAVNALTGCSSLVNIEVASDNTAYSSEDGVLFNKDKTEIIKYPARKTDTAYTIPNSVTRIGNGAFDGCESLADIAISDSVTSIGNVAFRGCTSFTSVTIPDSVTSIGGWAFSSCTSLTDITIPSSIAIIDKGTFNGCTSLTSITIPDSVINVGSYAFDDTAWYNNQPDGIVYVSKFAYGYKGDMPENTSITLKDGTKGIVDDAFFDCNNLTSITIPDSVTSIGDSAFYCCTNLTSIIIPDSVTSIGDSAFSGCDSLTSIIIPDSVTSIGDRVFGYGYKDLVIYGYSGSAAETYADKYGFTFVALDSISLGDVNDDNNIDISDATTIQKAVAQITSLTEAQQTAADVNGDGVVDINDATTVQKFVAQIITAFPAA